MCESLNRLDSVLKMISSSFLLTHREKSPEFLMKIRWFGFASSTLAALCIDQYLDLYELAWVKTFRLQPTFFSARAMFLQFAYVLQVWSSLSSWLRFVVSLFMPIWIVPSALTAIVKCWCCSQFCTQVHIVMRRNWLGG